MFAWVLCGILCIVILVLLVKIQILRKSVDEICIGLKEHLSNESNTLILISSKDKHIRSLAAELNKQLRLLRKQRREYLYGNRKLKEAVTNISHDLRTPLTAICGYIDLLESEAKSASVERYLTIIHNRVELLTQLTEELFRYTIALDRKNEVAKKRVVLNEMIEESVAEFYAMFKERKMTPIIHLPQVKVERTLDQFVLSRILSNLLNNAIKYSDGDLEITLTKSGEITFLNTASQLNQVQVAKLFDRFYTVNDAEKSTGLGLEITRTLVKQMDGTISAEYSHNQLSICIQVPDSIKNS